MNYLKAFCTCSLLSSYLCGTAQSDLRNSGTLFITSSSDTLYINGSFTNAGTLSNGGNIHVTGDISNTQSFSSNTGNLSLVGSALQTVSGTQTFKTLNLVTDNSAGVLLNANLSVAGAHTFVNGLIASSATPNYLVYEAGSSYSGDGDAGHVSGWVKKMGNTAFSFPVGNSAVERKVDLTNLASTSEFNVKHFETTPNTGNVLAPLQLIDPNEYWQINQVSGGSAVVAMNWNNSKIVFPQYPLGSIRTAYYTAGQWTNQGGSAAGDVTTTGNISSNTVSSFGMYTFGSISATLPLNFLSASASRNNGQALVEWRTADEVNVSHFVVERSTDGRNFIKQGVVFSKNVPGESNYIFPDNNAPSGNLWYRIKSIDNDGKFMYSKVMSILDHSEKQGLFVVVNPVRSYLSLIAGNIPAGVYNYQLHTEDGRVIQSGRLGITGSGTYSVALKGAVSPGIYILSINKGIFVQHEKLRVL